MKRRIRVSNRDAAGHGLGDIVEALTTAVGIKPCAGCKRRKAALNKVRITRTGPRVVR